MLIADCNNFPVGQIFVQLHSDEFNKPLGQKRAYLYSLRVMDMFQGKGIGTLLLDRAEETVAKASYQWINIAAAKNNHAARRMYEHRGYRVFAEDSGDWNYLDHQGKVQHVHEPCWILEKRLHLR
jgi:ribosomal protein S18 acetylase RimI-like enzyme